jgi:hypothetical protein
LIGHEQAPSYVSSLLERIFCRTMQCNATWWTEVNVL